jgi:hypothetical protein
MCMVSRAYVVRWNGNRLQARPLFSDGTLISLYDVGGTSTIHRRLETALPCRGTLVVDLDAL